MLKGNAVRAFASLCPQGASADHLPESDQEFRATETGFRNGGA